MKKDTRKTRKTYAPGWHMCCDNLYRKDRPDCPNGNHKFIRGTGSCENCDFSFQPHYEVDGCGR